MPRFLSITTRRGYDTNDELAGKPLSDGESLLLRWPDGSEERHTVSLDQRHWSDSEQGGGAAFCSDNKAYVVVRHKGATAKVYLRESKILAARL